MDFEAEAYATGATMDDQDLDRKLAREHEAFTEIRPGLMELHLDRVALIEGGELHGVYDEMGAARAAGTDKFGKHAGFLVIKIRADPPILMPTTRE